MKVKNLNIAIATVAVLFYVALSSCKKILDEKSNESITSVNTIKDLEAILRNTNIMNQWGLSMADIGADDYSLSSSAFANMSVNYQNGYKWDKDTQLDGWGSPYATVYGANFVLQEMEKLKDGAPRDRNILRGQALFFRSFSLFQLSQAYCKPYSQTANVDLGLPLRLTANVEEKLTRSTLQQTYDKIISDTQEALTLLDEKSITPNLPSKVACYGLLARMYLSMQKYKEAGENAEKYLSVSSSLLDFNGLDTLAYPSLPAENSERIFDCAYAPVAQVPVMINPELLKLYAPDDLRRKVLYFFNGDGTALFKGSYNRLIASFPFCGIATNEIYLIRAECYARQNLLSKAAADLNMLLEKRYKTATYQPAVFTQQGEAITRIILERRKELVFRSTRWSDLRRLNLEGANISLLRTVNNENYTLPANDKRWVWLIPIEVIRLAEITQNER